MSTGNDGSRMDLGAVPPDGLTMQDPDLRRVKLLTAAQVADLCHVDRSTVWRWTQRVEKELPTVRFGSRCVRFRLVDVERFQEQFLGSA